MRLASGHTAPFAVCLDRAGTVYSQIPDDERSYVRAHGLGAIRTAGSLKSGRPAAERFAQRLWGGPRKKKTGRGSFGTVAAGRDRKWFRLERLQWWQARILHG